MLANTQYLVINKYIFTIHDEEYYTWACMWISNHFCTFNLMWCFIFIALINVIHFETKDWYVGV